MQLVLGTAQLGLDYGITNSNGKPRVEESLRIIKCALENNISIFDTARGYGESEHVLGLARQAFHGMRIVTKLDALASLDSTTSEEDTYKLVDNSIDSSLKNLNIGSIETLLVHRFEHFLNKTIWNYLVENDFVKNLGVSVYYVSEAIEALKDRHVKHVQLPMNVLDQQWFSDEFLRLVEEREDVTIHCRSILLQGILVSDATKWPNIDDVEPEEYIKKLSGLVKLFKLNNRLELCFSYIKSISWIDGLVVGVDNIEQLEENVSLSNVRALSPEELQITRDAFINCPSGLLNPACW